VRLGTPCPGRKLEQHVFRIQKRSIDPVSVQHRAVHKYTKAVDEAEAARLVAVDGYTREQGKKTAGVDGVKSVQTQERLSWPLRYTQSTETPQHSSLYDEFDTQARES